jgi:hypothetical protein
MSGFPKMEVVVGIVSLSLSLKFRFKNKFLGFAKLIDLSFRVNICEVHLFDCGAYV